MTIEIDSEVYNQAAELFKNLGTTIENMTVGFLKFCTEEAEENFRKCVGQIGMTRVV